MSNIRNSGTILVFLGAVFWSLNAPLVKFLTADPLLICGLRSIIAGITLMPFIRWKRLNWTPWMFVYISSYCACENVSRDCYRDAIHRYDLAVPRQSYNYQKI